MMIFPTKADFIRYLASLEMAAAVVVTNDHGNCFNGRCSTDVERVFNGRSTNQEPRTNNQRIEGIITHTIPGIAVHTIRFTQSKVDPGDVEFAYPEWHWPNGLPSVLHGTRPLTRDELIVLLVALTPVRQYNLTLAYPG